MAEETKLHFPREEAESLEPHLPPPPSPSALPSSPTQKSRATGGSSSPLPFVTLTFATSLDSALALGQGIRTALSGPRSKAMTHYLRSRHDAICVGVGTAIADDPGLNCRLEVEEEKEEEEEEACVSSDAKTNIDTGAGGVVDSIATTTTRNARQPRPIIVDPRLRWDFTADSKVMRLARLGKGLAPYILTFVKDPPEHKRQILSQVGGKFIVVDPGLDNSEGKEAADSRRFDWVDILSAIRREGLNSVMIEGGGEVINSLLSENASLVDSVIVTIAPIWLGQGGVIVSPPRIGGPDRPVARLTDTMWLPLGEDVVLCGRIV
ncbi:dihydrofolate reductase-like domain-containing protein [Poronia punctata]|nr:dihydrofolate reductase-like domain-containing protein [Poronia punctata]